MAKRSKPKRVEAHRPTKSRPTKSEASTNWWRDGLWLLPAVLLGCLVYLNGLHGEFVYDDQLQISRNTLIQDPSQFWRALTSDVWGFQGGDQTSSNYWRPSFILWLILNFRCFGFELFGWHLASIFLHVVVVTVAFALLRRLAISAPVAGAIVLIFAVHPTRCESVTWLSGAPDLLLAIGLLASMYFVQLLSERQTLLRWTLAIGLYGLALGAKEMALLFPIVVAVLVYQNAPEEIPRARRWKRIASITSPFIAAAIIYFFIRLAILGTTQKFPEGGATLVEGILTAPAVVAFYLRQIVFPFWIGPSYPVRAVSPHSIGIGNFIIPLVITAVAICAMIWMAKRSKIARIGLSLFLMPLIPVMNIMAFGPEQLVHDRYLYLPLLGFLIVLVPVLVQGLERLNLNRIRPAVIVFILAAIISVPLSAQTVRYNRAWTSNLGLWEWGVRSDPTSAYGYQQYGVQLHEAKRLEEAAAALNRSIELKPLASTYVVRSTVLMEQGNFAKAESDLRAIVSQRNAGDYTLYRAYRDLGVCLSNQGRTREATEAIKQGRRRLPQYTAALTGKLASILWKAGKKDEAVNEIEAVRQRARTESLPESRLLLYGLGLLELELGHPTEARAAFQDFLSASAGMLAPGISQARSEAEGHLRTLNP